jgi:hypothetical protein
MSIDLEDQLREAFGDLPEGTPNSATTTERVLSRAQRLRRGRALRFGGGATAVAAAVVAACLVGTTFHTSPASGELRPAAIPATSAPAATASPTKTVPGSVDTSHLYRSKRIARVGGYLLPRGNQLPAGLRYEGADGEPLTTSVLNAEAGGVFLASGLGADVPGAHSSAPDNFGVVATATDLSSNHHANGSSYGDGDDRQRTLGATVTRFRSSAFANSAIGKAKAGNGPIIWFSSKTVPLSWSGVSGTTGAHYLYDMGMLGTKEDYLAIQIIGPFIVSATSSEPTRSTQAVDSMVTNLRTAKLVK